MEEAAVDAVVARAVAAGEEIAAVDVVCVLDLQMQYLREIGAVGETVERGESASDDS